MTRIYMLPALRLLIVEGSSSVVTEGLFVCCVIPILFLQMSLTAN